MKPQKTIRRNSPQRKTPRKIDEPFDYGYPRHQYFSVSWFLTSGSREIFLQLATASVSDVALKVSKILAKDTGYRSLSIARAGGAGVGGFFPEVNLIIKIIVIFDIRNQMKIHKHEIHYLFAKSIPFTFNFLRFYHRNFELPLWSTSVSHPKVTNDPGIATLQK